jgi:hypothetical protein
MRHVFELFLEAFKAAKCNKIFSGWQPENFLLNIFEYMNKPRKETEVLLVCTFLGSLFGLNQHICFVSFLSLQSHSC